MTIMSGILFWMLLVIGKNLGDGLMLCYMILGAAFIFLLYGHTLILIPTVIVWTG